MGKEAKKSDWEEAVRSPKFQAFLQSKQAFVIPAVLFFVAYYFALPLLVGYMPELMSKKVLGQLNLAYLFALSQFFMAWTIAFLYLRAAGRFDRQAEDILQSLGKAPKGRRS